jgi:hypothetical protein
MLLPLKILVFAAHLELSDLTTTKQWYFNNKLSPSCAHRQKQLNIDKPTQKEQDELAGSYTLHTVLKCLQPSNPL